MPDFLQTGPFIAEILRFFYFPNVRCPHLGLFNREILFATNASGVG